MPSGAADINASSVAVATLGNKKSFPLLSNSKTLKGLITGGLVPIFTWLFAKRKRLKKMRPQNSFFIKKFHASYSRYKDRVSSSKQVAESVMYPVWTDEWTGKLCLDRCQAAFKAFFPAF
jgi:hypothetical protein